MTIYLLKDYPENAATSSSDATTLLSALANQATTANATAIANVESKFGALVAGDTGEPLIISSIDDTAGNVSSWVTDASTTLTVGLGDPDTNNNSLYASTLSFSIVGNTRTGTLALNTNEMLAAVNRGRFVSRCVGLAPSTLTLHIQKTTNGATETVGMLRVRVIPPVIGGTPVELSRDTYPTTAAIRAGYIINLSGVTSLTGGGATTLDGQDAGSTQFPVGCVAVTSDSVASTGFRFWKLVAGTLAATDLATLKVKPTNYNATTNAVYWQG